MVQREQETVTYRQNLGKVLPLVAAAVVLLLFGLWMRWPIVMYDGPLTQDDLVNYSVDRFAYSDIASLYLRDGLSSQPRPYLDYQLEYPVGTGLLIYLLNLAAPTLQAYFLLNLFVLAACGVVVAWLIEHFPRGRVWLFALSPSLALHVGLNWDMWSIMFMVASLLLFVRDRDGWGAAMLAAAVWTKFFPIVLLPFLLLDRLQHKGWRAAAKVASIFALSSVVINAPLLLVTPKGFWHFFQYNASREGELNFMTLFLGIAPQNVQALNTVSTILLIAGVFVLCGVQAWRSQGEGGRGLPAEDSVLPCPAWLFACAAALAWFFFTGKVYSPQYGLWIVVILAIVGASTTLAVAWSMLDLAYFGASFITLGLDHFSPEARELFKEHALEPAAVLREGMLLLVALWCVWQIRTLLLSHRQEDRAEYQPSPSSDAPSA